MKTVLLVTKNYPPQLWGMEKYAFDLHQNLMKLWNRVVLVKSFPRFFWLYKNKLLYFVFEFSRLILFLFYVLFVGVFLSRKADIIWSADWSISLLCVFLSLFAKKGVRVYVTIHGKDISWDFPGYNYLLNFSLKRADKIYAVSNFIKNKILQKYPILEDKTYLSPHSTWNISFSPPPDFDRAIFFDKYNIPKDKIILFSLWRFVSKKWFDWFVLNVLPSLNEKYHYLLWGFWPLEHSILKILQLNKTGNYTFLWPIQDDLEKAKFYSIADYFVMPNVPIPNDVEGFWIVLLEANYYHVPIICSDSDNIDQNWEISVPKIVIKANDVRSWVSTINSLQWN